MAQNATKRVVWILGAGFSVPLGGPLFATLVSEPIAQQLEDWPDYGAANPPESYSAKSAAPIVALLYECGRVHPQPRTDTPSPLNIWIDAEQFIDLLDVARREPDGFVAKRIKIALSVIRNHPSNGSVVAVGNPRMVVINHFVNDLGALHKEAVRFVAGACSTFLLRAEAASVVVDDSEQWAPYRRWFDLLEAGRDTVITFNYDRVLNLLTEYGRRCSPAKDVFASPVWHSTDYLDSHAESVVPMLHLHGHVGWRRSPDGQAVLAEPMDTDGTFRDLAVAHRDLDAALIGVPGQDKRTLPRGVLEDLWGRAMAAIQDADAIVLVGYRFPETDNEAKRRIIDALKTPRPPKRPQYAPEPPAKVHVILGPDNRDTPRVQAMLEWTGKRVHVHPVWTQDFFTAFERNGLF